MNLANFENYIDSTIMARGKDYYENGSVLSLEKTDDNIYEAEVEGTEIYLVEVELDDEGNILDTVCDCPYDVGQFCKHQAAVLLALRKSINSPNKPEEEASRKMPEETKSAPIIRRRKTEDIRKILAARTKEELIDFLYMISSEYEEIKSRIEMIFAVNSKEDEIKKAVTLIESYIKKHSDRYGFGHYNDAFEAIQGAEMVLEKARYTLEQDDCEHALALALCVVREMIDLLQGADDSDGVVSSMVDEGMDFINEIIESDKISTANNEILFSKLLEEAADSRYDDWDDWRLELLTKCSEFAADPQLRGRLEKTSHGNYSNTFKQISQQTGL